MTTEEALTSHPCAVPNPTPKEAYAHAMGQADHAADAISAREAEYAAFLLGKSHSVPASGFMVEAKKLHKKLFDWQRVIVKWALRRGKAALFEDCGLGKTFQQLEWGKHVCEKTGQVLLLCPLAVAEQTHAEAVRFGYKTRVVRNQSQCGPGINIANYEMLGNKLLDTQSSIGYYCCMESTLTLPVSLQEAVLFFADPSRAHQFAVMLRWPDGRITCPRCDHDKHSFISTRRIYFCKGCKKQFTVKVASIFEDSPLGMDKWMLAVWLIVTCKNGISSYEMASHLKITQKSAWFLLHRVRKALQNGSFVKLGGDGGEVEVDETYIGGKARNMHKDRKERVFGKKYVHGPVGKVAIQGLLDRHGEVRARVVGNVNHEDLRAGVRQHVNLGTKIYSDEIAAYRSLPNEGFEHEFVHHAEKYVDGKIHTNGLENFWSLLKRGLKGTYVSVEPFHLFRYVDEQSFRYNNRKETATERFVEAMANVGGKRLTWEQLTGKRNAEGETQTI